MCLTKFILIGSLIFLSVGRYIQAENIEESLSIKIDPEVSNVYERNDTGLIYRGGVDMNPPSGASMPEVGFGAPVSIGCGRFDFAVNLRNMMTEQAMTDYVSNLGAEVLAASPLLLLEYMSPTMADALKQFQGIAYERLPGLYADCETIVAEGGLTSQLKKTSDAYKILFSKITGKKEGGNIQEEMETIKKEANLAGLLDYYGKPIGDRKHKLIEEGIKWATQAEPEDITKTSASDLGKLLAGDIVISGETVKGAQVTMVFPKWDIEDYFENLKRNLNNDLKDLTEKRRKGEIISGFELAKVSTDTVPVTNPLLKEWGALSKKDRPIIIGKQASALAIAKVSSDAHIVVNRIIKASGNIHKSDIEKKLLRDKADVLREQVVALRDLRGEEERVAATIANSLDTSAIGLLEEAARQEAKNRPLGLMETIEAEGWWGME